MKKICILISVIVFVLGCDSGSINNHNPNIPDYPVNVQLNLNFYPVLQIPGNYTVDYSANSGARGIVIFNTGSGYNAFDLACPNQDFTICTQPMSIAQGAINATCGCDNTVYSLYTGQCAGQPYPMKQYRVQVSGGYLYVTN
jgi:nitrite reductase/ring-hydroxylating ferredoxin subunit